MKHIFTLTKKQCLANRLDLFLKECRKIDSLSDKPVNWSKLHTQLNKLIPGISKTNFLIELGNKYEKITITWTGGEFKINTE